MEPSKRNVPRGQAPSHARILRLRRAVGATAGLSRDEALLGVLRMLERRGAAPRAGR